MKVMQQRKHKKWDEETSQCKYCIYNDNINHYITIKTNKKKNKSKFSYIIVTIKKNQKRLLKTNKKFDVILDSGASKSYFNNLKMLTHFKKRNSSVMLGNNTITPCLRVGKFGVLKNVSFVTELRLNLLSTKHLCLDNTFLFFLIRNELIYYVEKHYIIRDLKKQS
jgi:hypothetical protein